MDTSFGHANVKKRILLLSGTHEGPLLARALVDAGFDVRATVTREEARSSLFGSLQPTVQVEARGFTVDSLSDFLSRDEADLVLDATHPFAVRITVIAQEACRRRGTPLVRYERPDWVPPEGTLFSDSFADTATRLHSLGDRIMLTIGAKQLKHFATLHECLHLMARVLPAPVSVQQALDAGFTQDRILAMRPPFSRELNRAIFQEYRRDVLVTKASGCEGGVIEKVLAARDLGMQVLMIRRPASAGLATVSSVPAAVQACLAAVGA